MCIILKWLIYTLIDHIFNLRFQTFKLEIQIFCVCFPVWVTIFMYVNNAAFTGY